MSLKVFLLVDGPDKMDNWNSILRLCKLIPSQNTKLRSASSL
jgi:hypothetical protein